MQFTDPPKKKRSLFGRIYRAFNAFSHPLERCVLPMSTGTPVLPTKTARVIGRPQGDGFWPTRFHVSNAGTPGGAADWIVNDIKIAGRSQFIQSGDVPGDLFATNAVYTNEFFDAVKAGTDVELTITYIGPNDKGCPFYGSIVGTEYDPGILEILREAIAAAFTSAARGISTRPHR